ncbi:hypothetical protein JXB28_04305, partial [Candidatus Woesearchaeota archaeon]|nr:hypothetical protein [Candidatus Woesearchaeota archaeon]
PETPLMIMAPTIELPLPESIKAIEKSKVQLEINSSAMLIKGIPKGHTLEFLAKEKHGNNFYLIHWLAKRKDYSHFNLYIGPEKCLRKVQVEKALKNGVTINVRYIMDEKPGELIMPYDPKKGPNPMDVYNGRPSKLENIIDKPHQASQEMNTKPARTKHI